MKILKKICAKGNDRFGKPAATIAFLGDSVTQGCFECYITSSGGIETVFDPDNSFPSLTVKFLHILYPAAQINLINAGISGDSAPSGLARFGRDIAPYVPDLVVIGYGLNDSARGFEGINDYAEAINGICRKSAEVGAECIILTPNMMNTTVSCHLKSDTMRSLACSFANSQERGILDKYVEAAVAVAEERDIPVCDMYSRWKEMSEYGVDVTELLANKLNHPIREMSRVTAMALVETMFNK